MMLSIKRSKFLQKIYEKKLCLAMQLIEESGQILTNENSASIQRIVKFLPDSYIINRVGMADMSLIVYLLWIKYAGNIKLISITDDVMIRIGKINVANMSYLAVYIHFISIDNDYLKIEGNTSYPTILGKNHNFYVKVNGKKINVKLEDIGLDLKRGINKYESRTSFIFEYKLKDTVEIQFFNEIDGMECPYGKINSMRFSPIADCIDNQYCVIKGWMLYIVGNKIYCHRTNDSEIAEREKIFQKSLLEYNPSKAEWAIKLRKKYYEDLKNKNKPIWLFMDRTNRAGDNASVFFRYVQKYDNIKSYFVIAVDSGDYEKMKQYGNVIPLYSEEHYRLTFLADFMISSQANGVVENPFWENAEMFRDIYHHPKLVFLQHGVIKDDMSPTLNRINTNFTGFITSSFYEWKSILEFPYRYTEKEVWLTGLPRFDELYNDPQKCILIMPSWRNEIMQHVWSDLEQNMVWQVKGSFQQSQYFRKYYSLLRNIKLLKKCKDFGYKLIFMPHPLMEKYGIQLTNGSECELWGADIEYREAFAKGCILISDYSSVVFDFAYLEKPVLYYQFDKEQFFNNHTYKKGYFDYEKDGFGEVCYTENQLVDVICEYIDNKMQVKRVYQKHMKHTFKYHDKNNCERIYSLLTKGKEQCDELG